MILLLLSWFILLSASLRITSWTGSATGLLFSDMIPGLAILLLVLQVWGFFLPLQYAGIGIGMLGVWWLLDGGSRIIGKFFIKHTLLRRKAASNDLLSKYAASAGKRGPWSVLALLLVCLMPAVLPAWVNDDFAYYLPGIKWFAGEGWVPGLANLNVRFGLSSSWHALSAAFYWEGISPERIWNFNGLMLFLFCKELLDRFPDKPFAVWGALLFGVPFCNAPSPDLLVALLGAYALINYSKLTFMEWMWWAVLLIGLKATALSVLLLFPLAFLSITKKNRLWLLLPGLAGLVWVVKNMVLSGHPFFPYALFEVANAVPANLLKAFREGVLAEIYGVGFSMEEWRSADLSWTERLAQLTQIRTYKVGMNVLILTSTSLLLAHFLRLGKKHLFVAFLLGLGALFWLFVTPNYRFFLAPLLACGVFLNVKIISEWRYASYLILLPLAAAFWMNLENPEPLRIISCGRSPALSFEQIFVPVPYPVLESETVPLNDKQEVFRPGDCMYCGNAPQPCYPDTIRSYNQAHGYSLTISPRKFELEHN